MKRSSPKNTRAVLPKKLISQLGRRPDQALADEFRVAVERVRRERLSRGISRVGYPSKISAKDVALLGTASDAEIAARLGVAPNAVNRQRQRREIKPFGATREQKRHRWTKRQLAWLGKLSDQEIANRTGIDPTTVRWKRVSMRIDPVQRGRSGRVWTKSELALLGKVPDTVIARRIGVHRHKVALKRMQLGISNAVIHDTEKRWTKKRLDKLGKVFDAELAKEMGIKTATVRAYRYRHDIPSKLQPGKLRQGPHTQWRRSHVERLGIVPDAELADELGLTKQAVASMRQRLGIQARSARRSRRGSK